MSATATAPTPLEQSQNTRPPRNPRPRRPRGNRGVPNEPPAEGENHQHISSRNKGGRAQPARDGLLALRPASLAPTIRPLQAAPSSTLLSFPTGEGQESTGQVTSTSAGHSRSRGRGARGNATRHQNSIVQTRHFGGSLTTGPGESTVAIASTSDLQADAAEFQLGNPLAASGPRPRIKQPQQPRKRRASRSTAPDIATRIHEDIDNRQYECPICTNEVLRHSKVWSCKTCWTVFHLSCITQWSSNKDSSTLQPHGQIGEMANPPQWRCPGCNLPQDTKPRSYACWCGKDDDPRSISGLPPHSCGQTCGKPRLLPKKCPHPCELLCHAGPCPPCTHIGPSQRCFCGKESTLRRCVETQYEGGWSCGKPCGDLMACGAHSCPRECHEGLCGACEVRVDARCYCGKEEKTILCCDKDDERTSRRIHPGSDDEHVSEEWIGLFQCANTCDRYFDCAKHQCEKPCHVQDGEMDHCPRSPDTITHCPCGKTLLDEISDTKRQSCQDRIPNCSKVCSRPLPCSHSCQQICHTGKCMPCMQKVTIHCRCGRTASTTICHQGTEEPPQCTRVCRTTLNCGRHECGERCCAGERKAVDRQTTKRKLKPLGSTLRPLDDAFEAEHICTRPCGRPLKCGNHLCEELCHKGPCGSCREAIFDEISCHCGRTVLQPPLPCGTKVPPCRFDCGRLKDCGHPQIPHNCHSDDESCPKCPFLTEKTCLCGKKSLKNQQCWFTDVRCGDICGKRLKCGSHTCRKTCHKAGECEDAAGACQQACGKPKKSCGHPDENTCHAPYPCKEDKPCPHKTIITCDCQHNKQEMRCNASKASEGNTTKSLKCDDECGRLERNRKLALALDIDPETHKDEHIPYAQETINLFQDHPKWSQDQEREFRVFAGDESEKRLRFKPMTPNQRAFLHHLAEDFGFDSESMDPEPHRHVAIFKTPRFVSAPNKTLRDCVRIRQSQRIAAAAEATAKAKSSVVNEPYNGFLLTNPKFALTLDDLRSEIAAVQGPTPKTHFNIHFLGSGDVAFKAIPQPSLSWSERAVDLTLRELRLPLARAFNGQGFGSLQLCRLDEHLDVLRREMDSASEGGWSQVAAKAATAARKAPGVQAVGVKSAFTVLGNLNAKKSAEKKRVEEEARRRKEESVVVEDWEVAEVEEEKREEMGRRSGMVSPLPPTTELDGAADGESPDFVASASTNDGTDEVAIIVTSPPPIEMSVNVGGEAPEIVGSPRTDDGSDEAPVAAVEGITSDASHE